MTVLITGAGVIGTHAAQRLVSLGHPVVLYDLKPNRSYVEQVAGDVPLEMGNVCDLERLLQVMSAYQVDRVVHAAGVMGHFFQKDTYNAYRLNVNGGAVMAEACTRHGVRRLVYCSSLAVYGSFGSSPVSESAALRPTSVYGASKVANELLFQTYAVRHGWEVAALRFAGIYGYGPFAGGAWMGRMLEGHLQRALRNEQHISWDDLGTNEYLYVKDAARGVEAALFAEDVNGKAFNIATGRQHAPHEVAHAVQAAIGREQQEIPADLVRRNERMAGILDIALARNLLSYSPSWTLEEGIADLLRCLQEAGQKADFLERR